MLMRKVTVRKIWILAFLMAGFVAGCGDADKNPGAGNPGAPLTPPTVISVTPTDATPVCPNTAVITATFSKPMNPATINSPATSFTLTLNGATVPGTVTYVAATNIATFTPTSPIAATTTYTATISGGAQDQYGKALTPIKVWTFTTSAVCL